MKKRIAFICLVSTLFTIVSAQSIGLKAGISVSNGSTNWPTHYNPGLFAGISGDIPVSESVFLSSGLLFIKKGTKRDWSGTQVRIPVWYLEIPVNTVYKFDFGTWKLFANAGIYTGVGLSAKIKNGDETEKVEFGHNTGQYKKMDYGMNLGGGAEIDNVQVGLNYGFGFINISRFTAETIRNRVFTVSAVYSL